MTRFLTDTLTDIRRGRETWRVFVALCAPSFVLALLAATLQHLA
jgi:hypothetical protein